MLSHPLHKGEVSNAMDINLGKKKMIVELINQSIKLVSEWVSFKEYKYKNIESNQDDPSSASSNTCVAKWV